MMEGTQDAERDYLRWRGDVSAGREVCEHTEKPSNPLISESRWTLTVRYPLWKEGRKEGLITGEVPL